MYRIALLLHVLAACLAIGSTATYGAWGLMGAKAGEAFEGFALRGIQWVDKHIANPAFAVLLLSGGAMVHLGGQAWSEAWLWQSALGMLVTETLAYAVFQPLLRRQIAAFERGGSADAQYQRLSAQALRLGWAFTAINAYILILMVYKPAGLF